MVRAAQWGGQGGCYCKAKCKRGSCDGGLPHVGWTDNTVTAPYEMWHAQCNVGQQNCEDDCVKDAFLKKVEKCRNITNDSRPCFHKLQLETADPEFDARDAAVWCVKKGMKTCDSFLTYPTTGGWQCFKYLDNCQ